MADETLREAIEESAKEVDEQIATPETPAESSTEEVSQEDKELQDLDNDAEFKEALDEQTKEMGVENLSFGQTKRFRTLYRQKKDLEREREELQSQIDSKPEVEPVVEIAEERLRELADKKGYQLTKEEKKEAVKLQEMLDKVQKPEDREWLKNYASAVKQDLTKEISEKYDVPLNQMAQVVREYQLDMSERKARSLIKDINAKHGTAIDFDKDVDPELTKMIKADKNITPYNTDLSQLTQRYLAEKGIELGKKLSAREQQKMNEEKKKAAMETSGTTSAPKVDDSNASVTDIMKDEMKREGIQNWL